jgi:hypothetical protein
MLFPHYLLIGTIPSAIATFLPDDSAFLAHPQDGLSSDIFGVDSYTHDPNLEIVGALDETAFEQLIDVDETAPLLMPDDGFWTASDNECPLLSKRSRMKLRAESSCPAVAPLDIPLNIPLNIPLEIPEEERFCPKKKIPACCEPDQMLGSEWYEFTTATCQVCEYRFLNLL